MSKKYLTVEVEHTHYAKLMSLDRAGRVALPLTTLVDRQKRAEVKVYLFAEERKHLLHNFSVDPLPPQKAGEPRIELRADFDGKKSLTLSLRLNGRFHSRREISLRKYLKKGRLTIFLVSAALLLLLPLLLLRLCASPEVPEVESRYAETDRSYAGSVEQSDRRTEYSDQSTDTESSYLEDDLSASGDTSDRSRNSSAQEALKTVEDSAVPAEDSEASETTSDSDVHTSQSENELDAGETPTEDSQAPSTSLTETPETPAPIDLEETVYFRPNSAELGPEALQVLRTLAETLAEHPEAVLEISGHCALYGTEEGREELSRERAESTEAFLRSRGWRPDSPPRIRAMAGHEPVTRDSEAQHLNRRVELRLIPRDSNS